MQAINNVAARGVKTVAAADTPEAIAVSVGPVSAVWVGAPVDPDTGLATNTKTVCVGPAGGELIPLLPDDHKGYIIPVERLDALFVKATVDGESVVFVAYN